MPDSPRLTGRQRVLDHLAGKPVDSLPLMPITMMFAADFIGVPYHRYAMDYRVLAEGQVRVAEAFDFDHVSAISDPAREAADCGSAIAYFDDQPPAIREEEALLTEKTDLAKLKAPDPLGGGRMTDRVQGVALLKERVGAERLVEGWVEGPAAQGADLRGLNTLMLDFFDDPDFVNDLFAFVIAMELDFAKAQIQAGADIIGVGDAAASLAGPEIYREFIWPHEKRLVDGIHKLGAAVRLHICGNTRPLLADMGKLGCEIVDLDSMADLSLARQAMGPGQMLLGDLDPVRALRNSTPQAITAGIAECHRQAGPRYIVGVGCEIPRDTPHANVRALTDYARGHKP